MEREAFRMSVPIEQKGPVVRLDERRRILGELAAAYANSASKEVGLPKASANRTTRKALERRYGRRTDVVVQSAQAKARARRQVAEEAIPMLTQAEELAAIGFDIDPEAINTAMKIKIRQAIGSGRPAHERESQDRTAFVANLYEPGKGTQKIA